MRKMSAVIVMVACFSPVITTAYAEQLLSFDQVVQQQLEEVLHQLKAEERYSINDGAPNYHIVNAPGAINPVPGSVNAPGAINPIPGSVNAPGAINPIYPTSPVAPSPWPVSQTPGQVSPVYPAPGSVSPVYPSPLPVSPTPGPVSPTPGPGNMLVSRFNAVNYEMSRFRNDVTMLKSEISQRTWEIARIIASNQPDYLFDIHLRTTLRNIRERAIEVRRLESDVQNLVYIAQKSLELNSIARNMAYTARDLERIIQYDILSPVQNLKRKVYSAAPSLVGQQTQLTASDMEREATELSGKVRNISLRTNELIYRTQP